MGQRSRKGELADVQQRYTRGSLKKSGAEAIFQWEEDLQGSEGDT